MKYRTCISTTVFAHQNWRLFGKTKERLFLLPLLPFAGNFSYPYCAHSQYTTVYTLFWCPLYLQRVSALTGLLPPLVLHKECFLSLLCSRGCVLLSLLPKMSLCCLAHHSPSWGQGGRWTPWLSVTCHPSVPWAAPAVSRTPGTSPAVEHGWLFLWGPWSHSASGLQSISPCREESKSLFSKGSDEAVV